MTPLPVAPVVAAMMAAQALTTLAVLALAAVAPRVAADLRLDPALIGYQVSVIYGAGMAAALIGGGLVRRFGATRTSQCALFLTAAGVLLSALATPFSVGAGAVVIGLGYGLTNPAASHLLSRVPAAGNMNLIFSLKQSGVPLGGMLAGAIMAPLTVTLGWRAALVACAALMLAFAAVLVARRRRWDDDQQAGAPLFSAPFSSLMLVWRHDVLRWIAVSSFAYSGVQLCLIGFLVTYLVVEVRLDLLAAATVLTLTHAAGAAGRLIWGWVADRMRSGSIALAACGLLAAAGAIGLALVDGRWPLWAMSAASMLFGFCAIGWNGVFVAVVARQAPAGQVGVATGGTLFVTYAGVLVIPAAFAAAHERFGMGWSMGYALLALLSAAGVAAVLRARYHALRAR